jgi:hypothetical protein
VGFVINLRFGIQPKTFDELANFVFFGLHVNTENRRLGCLAVSVTLKLGNQCLRGYRGTATVVSAFPIVKD